MKSIDLIIKYYKTSGLEIPQPIQELIDEIDKLSPCEQEGDRQEIAELKNALKRIKNKVMNDYSKRELVGTLTIYQEIVQIIDKH